MNTPRNRRQYVWEKTGGLCWYCGSRLYRREDADTEVKKRLVFTADHFHPRTHGGRGRANKVPACKYCNSHKSSRSVEQFRQWVQALVFDKVRRDGAPFGKEGLGHWKIKGGAVGFYFELAGLSNRIAKALPISPQAGFLLFKQAADPLRLQREPTVRYEQSRESPSDVASLRVRTSEPHVGATRRNSNGRTGSTTLTKTIFVAGKKQKIETPG